LDIFMQINETLNHLKHFTLYDIELKNERINK